MEELRDFKETHPSIASKARTLAEINQFLNAAETEGYDLRVELFLTAEAVQDHTIDLQTLHELILEHAECKVPHLLADDRTATCLDMVLEQTSYHPPNPDWLPAAKVRAALNRCCQDIEKMPAGETQTAVSVRLQDLRKELRL